MIYLFSDKDSYISGRYIHYFYSHENNTFYYLDNTNDKLCGVYQYHKDVYWKRCAIFNYTLPDTLNLICTDFDDDIASICEQYKDKLIFDNI
jgi:hypothetical protein